MEKQREDCWLPRAEDGGNGQILDEWNTLSVMRLINSEDWVYCLMTILNKNIVFLKFAEKVHLKCSHHTPHTHTKIPRWRDGDVNKPYCGSHFSIHTCIKSLHCTTEIYTMLLISYISIKLEGGKTNITKIIHK